MKERYLYSGLLIALSIVLFWTDLNTLVRLALRSEYYNHILIVPAISAFFFYRAFRNEMTQDFRYNWRWGAILLGCAGVLYWLSHRQVALGGDNYLTLAVFSLVLFWVGGFLLIFGTQVYRATAFPLLLLFLMVPFPDFVLTKIIQALQQGSADMSYVLFNLIGVPVFRNGFFFTLPGLTVEVAEQCSGIHSSIALFILCLVIGQLFLKSTSRKVALFVSTLPILLFKNAVRIVTISLLSAYVSRDFLTGWLHKSGGVVFFLLGLLIMLPIIHFLERSERRGFSGGGETALQSGD